MTSPIPLGLFSLHEPIGRGSSAEVWRGVHRVQQLEVAVKVVLPDRALAEDDETDRVAQFAREARAVAGLDHPGIIRIFDHGEIPLETAMASGGRLPEGMPYLVMELVPGGSLLQLPTQPSFGQLRLRLLELLDALAHAHAREVIHRDIKAGNVLVDTKGSLKLSDFGIAHALRHRDQEATTQTTGTPHYMAPEQIRGDVRDQGPWTDLYAVGCLAYRMAKGHPPFYEVATDLRALIAHQLLGAPPPIEAEFELPLEFQQWLDRMLAKSPDNRYQYAADAAYDLMAMEVGEATITVDSSILDAFIKRHTGLPTLTIPTQWASEANPEDTGGNTASDPKRSTSVPPLPDTWKRPGGAARSLQLVGAGLGVYHLRVPPLIGRQDERDYVWQSLMAVRQTAQPRAVLLLGPAGVGKSRLAEWMCERAHEVGGAHVLRAGHAAFPGKLTGIPAMVARHLRLMGLDRPAIEARLAELIEGDDEESELERVAMAEFIHPALDSPEAHRFRFRSPRDWYGVIARFLRKVTRDRPAILWLDDVHYGFESLGFVQYLLGTDVPLLMVMTARDDALATRPLESQTVAELVEAQQLTTIEIAGLDEVEVTTLLRSMLGLEAGLVEGIAQRCRGNPLFAVGLVDDWVEREVLELGDDGFVLAQGAAATLPDDLHHVWVARIDQALRGLDPASWIVLELGAILGHPMDPAEWRRAGELAGVPLDEPLLQRLLDQRLLRFSEDGWTFGHQMLRESVERHAVDSGRYEQLHGVCGEALVSLYGPGDRACAERLGRHFCEAGLYADAIDPLLRGAQVEMQRSHFRAARDLMELRGAALEAAMVPGEDQRWGQQHTFTARCLELLGDLEHADVAAHNAIAAAERYAWDELLPRALLTRANVRRQKGDLVAATRYLERAIDASSKSSDNDTLATALLVGAELARRAGDGEQAERYIVEGEAAAAHSDNPLTAVNYIALRAQLALIAGELDSARSLYSRAAEQYGELGSLLGVANCIKGRADVERHAGHYARARRFYRQALTRYREIAADDAVARVDLLLVDVLEGKYEEALEALLLLVGELRAAGRSGFAAYAGLGLLPCSAALGKWNIWEMSMTALEQFLESSKTVAPDIAECLEFGGTLAAQEGHPLRASQALRMAWDQWQALGRKNRATAVHKRLEKLQP